MEGSVDLDPFADATAVGSAKQVDGTFFSYLDETHLILDASARRCPFREPEGIALPGNPRNEGWNPKSI